MNRVLVLALLTASTVPAVALAKPPMLEMYYEGYAGEDCLSLAEKTLSEVGFTLKSGTWEGWDRLGSAGDFKGAISCVKSNQLVAFVVAGPAYKKTNEYATRLRDTFKRLTGSASGIR